MSQIGTRVTTLSRPFALLVLAIGLAAGPAMAAEPDPFAPILHALDYLAVDYAGAVKDGKILDQGEYDEQVEFAASVPTMIAGLPARPERAALEATAAGLLAGALEEPGEIRRRDLLVARRVRGVETEIVGEPPGGFPRRPGRGARGRGEEASGEPGSEKQDDPRPATMSPAHDGSLSAGKTKAPRRIAALSNFR